MIKINDTYRLDSDQWNVILQKKINRESKKTGEINVVWKNVKYYPNYPAALEGLLYIQIHDVADVDMIVKKIDEFKTLVSEIFKGTTVIKQNSKNESEDK